MSEQQECYGIPYAMAVHDIERIDETTWYADHDNIPGANSLMRNNGWVLLAIRQTGNEDGYDALYVLGVPRPRFCEDPCQSPNSHPKRALKEWNHQRKEWECRWCIEDDARYHNDGIDGKNPPF